MITINDDVNEICGAADPGGLVVVLLTFVTFGIYGIYWHYKIGEKLDFCRKRENRAEGNFPLIFLVLSLLQLGVLNFCIAQTELNNYLSK